MFVTERKPTCYPGYLPGQLESTPDAVVAVSQRCRLYIWSIIGGAANLYGQAAQVIIGNDTALIVFPITVFNRCHNLRAVAALHKPPPLTAAVHKLPDHATAIDTPNGGLQLGTQ